MVVVVLGIGGCAGTGTATPDASDPFPVPRAEMVFDTGFSHIQDIYIDEPDLADLAMTGLNGLRTIDKSIAAVYEDGEARMIVGGAVEGRVRIDRRASAAAWAKAVTRLVMESRRTSKPLRAASTERIYEVVFDTLVRQLDPYTRYTSAQAAEEERARRDGFGGIGITVETHADGARVLEVEADQPAAAAGIEPGDRIVAIDGKALAGFSLRRIVHLLRGPIGREMTLKIRREASAEPFDVSVRRTRIVRRTVFYRRDDNFAYIRVTGFNHDTAEEMREAAIKARETLGPDLHGLIIDVRGNPGGLLDQAVELADLFLGGGQILSTRGRHPRSRQYFDARVGDLARGVPIAVLLDGASASAAEIVASALQDQGRAIVVGASSYGKGTVQTVLRLPNDGELILTWARIHAPSGYVLHQLGVLPTVCTSRVADVASAIEGLTAEGVETIRRNLRARRTANQKDAAELQTVRDLCPWQPREDGDLDLKIAERILERRDLYDKMLAFARPEAGS